jgi:hypothetical protein
MNVWLAADGVYAIGIEWNGELEIAADATKAMEDKSPARTIGRTSFDTQQAGKSSQITAVERGVSYPFSLEFAAPVSVDKAPSAEE